MSDWIDRAYEQKQQIQKERQHYGEVFPALAERMWLHIRTLIEEDAVKLREKFPELSSLEMFSTHPSLLEIRKKEYPAYYAQLTFDAKGQQFTVTQKKVLNAQHSPAPAKTPFFLSLDKAHQNVLIKLNGKPTMPEYVSEYCLRPLIEE